ncbi:NADPH-dependent oxidoreductase [Paracoccus suum]|uniref:NADPH-dependent oxidoreductase n=1 Tax=Paracoccus suum TaxID=2259340 RepID=A0A344PJ47_9RHOB|nr:NAD(P)H-dependent oxidoreductase [Paracoccus suum]AXC49402.1 NADPH-dependent oxidoreductase [Paracoccus suum]
MTSSKLKIGVIYGSAREGRFGDVIGAWLLSRLEEHPDVTIEIIDPREMDTSVRHKSDTPSAIKLREVLGRSDGFIVLVPEYNRSYPAALKAALDLAYGEWQAKAVAFVSYGGVSGGLRAVEHLRQVFAELHTVSIRDGVSFPNAWQYREENGQFNPPAEAETALALMLDKLFWWTQALKAARAAQPYDKAA